MSYKHFTILLLVVLAQTAQTYRQIPTSLVTNVININPRKTELRTNKTFIYPEYVEKSTITISNGASAWPKNTVTPQENDIIGHSENIVTQPQFKMNQITVYPEESGILPYNFLTRFMYHLKVMIEHMLFVDSKIPIENDITFHLITRSNLKLPYQLYIDDDSNLRNSPMSPARNTVLIIHGWCDNSEREVFKQLVTELLKSLDLNIIMVDWRRLSSHFYPLAAFSIDKVANFLKEFILYLEKLKYIKIDTLHLIGHSLGAQIASLIGRQFDGKISRITGLDPAGPLFEFWPVQMPKSFRLDASDAEFVDVIHTAVGGFGIVSAVGHVDFYPNYGIIPQPGCYSILSAISCSHTRAIQYLTESINSPIGFWGTKCSSALDYFCGLCATNPRINMGYWTPTSARGVYYLKTNSRSPYAQY